MLLRLLACRVLNACFLITGLYLNQPTKETGSLLATFIASVRIQETVSNNDNRVVFPFYSTLFYLRTHIIVQILGMCCMFSVMNFNQLLSTSYVSENNNLHISLLPKWVEYLQPVILMALNIFLKRSNLLFCCYPDD